MSYQILVGDGDISAGFSLLLADPILEVGPAATKHQAATCVPRQSGRLPSSRSAAPGSGHRFFPPSECLNFKFGDFFFGSLGCCLAHICQETRMRAKICFYIL